MTGPTGRPPAHVPTHVLVPSACPGPALLCTCGHSAQPRGCPHPGSTSRSWLLGPGVSPAHAEDTREGWTLRHPPGPWGSHLPQAHPQSGGHTTAGPVALGIRPPWAPLPEAWARWKPGPVSHRSSGPREPLAPTPGVGQSTEGAPGGKKAFHSLRGLGGWAAGAWSPHPHSPAGSLRPSPHAAGLGGTWPTAADLCEQRTHTTTGPRRG